MADPALAGVLETALYADDLDAIEARDGAGLHLFLQGPRQADSSDSGAHQWAAFARVPAESTVAASSTAISSRKCARMRSLSASFPVKSWKASAA